ncbi:hypothetical protein AU467_33130 [Mesorhizobium loti]|uniref:Sulfur globule protein n=1 Tax=Rhizobium loti TaxID=381 RepID=A0A101KMR7_RHILI|nr:hypothetical protein AU467_33130 [Mesorhizobium loti]
MRKLLLASVIAIASAGATLAPADARVFFGTGGYFGFGPFGDFYDSYGPYPSYGPYWGGPYYDYGPRSYGEYGGLLRYPDSYYAYRTYRHCRIETVRHRSHHHWVRREIRVCGY